MRRSIRRASSAVKRRTAPNTIRRCHQGMTPQFDGPTRSLSGPVRERKRLSAGEPLLELVPVGDLRLADAPAEKHVLPRVSRGKVEQPLGDVLDLDSFGVERRDALGDRLELTLDVACRVAHLSGR